MQEEKQRAIDRLNELIDLYYQVDAYDPDAPTPTPIGEGPGPTKNKMFRSPYHECASGVLNDPGVKEKYPDRKDDSLTQWRNAATPAGRVSNGTTGPSNTTTASGEADGED